MCERVVGRWSCVIDAFCYNIIMLRTPRRHIIMVTCAFFRLKIIYINNNCQRPRNDKRPVTGIRLTDGTEDFVAEVLAANVFDG